MLKRYSHIILSVLIFVVTTGMTISTHFCGGNIKDMSLFSPSQSCCDNPEGCCHDEVFTIKIEDDFSVSSYSFDFSQLEIVLPILIKLIQVEEPVKAKVIMLRNTIPPPKIQAVLSSLQTYIL